MEGAAPVESLGAGMNCVYDRLRGEQPRCSAMNWCTSWNAVWKDRNTRPSAAWSSISSPRRCWPAGPAPWTGRGRGSMAGVSAAISNRERGKGRVAEPPPLERGSWAGSTPMPGAILSSTATACRAPVDSAAATPTPTRGCSKRLLDMKASTAGFGPSAGRMHTRRRIEGQLMTHVGMFPASNRPKQ